MEIQTTEAESFLVGSLPRGCQLCMKGAKLALFVTGLCRRGCWFCPISEKRKGKDQTWANERLVEKDSDILEEAHLIDADGTGITGGDPLLCSDRAIHYIKLLKSEFGQDHHIHLYTAGDNITRKLLLALADAGLDEIRIHLNEGVWDCVKWALETEMVVGAEVPAIPGKESWLREVALYLMDVGADFININELEFSGPNVPAMLERGLELKPDSPAAVAGSEEVALDLLQWAVNHVKGFSLHYCPARLKDAYQLRNRLKRRARNVAKAYEEITDEGLLIKGIVEREQKVSWVDLQRLRKRLMDEFGVPEDYVWVDVERNRLETAWWIAEELAKDLKREGWLVAVLEEYPTIDRLETERAPL